MTDVEKQKQMEQIKQSEDGMRQTVLLIKIGLMVFLTFACCTVFFFLVLRYKGVADTWHLITGALQPIIIGLGLAYLLNPVMKFQERHWLPFLKKKMKSEKSAAKVARGLSIAGAILFLLVILVLLIAAIVPSVVSSVTGLVEALPGNVESLIRMVKSGKLGAYGVTDTISDMLTKLTDYVENWATNDLLPQMQQYLLQITSGVITMVKSILNFIIGIIVVVYVLSIKESLVGQGKKIVYAIFKPKQGNIIIEVFHKADEVFGGFIIGKIIELPKEAHMRDNIVYELTLENISEDTSDTLDVRVLNPYDKVKLYKYDGNGWVEVEHRVKGSYVQTSMQGTSGQFCLVNESTNPMIYVIIGGCTAGVLAVFIIVKVIKSGIKRRKKKAKLSDEEK